MKVTQKDIAERMGVSTSLVSRVLSGQAYKIGVNQQKIDEITKVAKEMNYVPSSAALILKGKKTRTVGLVVYDFYDPHFSTLVYELQEQAHVNDYSTLLVGFLNRKAKNSDLFPLMKHAVDGIIVLGSYGDLAWTESFPSIPIVRIGHGEHPNLALSVAVDENDAMRKILSHLSRDIGLKKITYVCGNGSFHTARRDAFQAVASEFGLDESKVLSANDENDFKSGTKAARELLKSGRDRLPEAVVTVNDSVAMGMVKEFFESGVRVPEDVAVAGFDDIPAASNYIPSVTSFRQPVKTFAQKCFAKIMEEDMPKMLEIEGELIVRKSSMRK